MQVQVQFLLVYDLVSFPELEVIAASPGLGALHGRFFLDIF